MGPNPKRISKEELAAAMRHRPVASGSGIAVAVAGRSPAFACAVIVSKKVAPLATARNRIRRRIREALRRIASRTGQLFTCVLIVRTSGIPQGPALEAALVELLHESGILIR